MKDNGCSSSPNYRYVFISHMVQMKAFLSLDVKSSESELYIPHGSDESDLEKNRKRWKSTTLYPTWFRWKLLSLFLILL